MRLRLPKFQKSDSKAKDLGNKDLLEGWEDVEGVLQHQGLLYIPEIICCKLISSIHNNPLAEHFEISKTKELVAENTSSLPSVKMLKPI